MSYKVLLLFSSSELGGTEKSLTRMSSIPSNVDYYHATLDGEGPWCEWVRKLGFFPLVLGRSNKNKKNKKIGIGKIFSLVSYVKKKKIDIIYVCGFRAALILRFVKVFLPKVKLVQGIRWNPNSKSLLDYVFRFVERYLFRLVDKYIANSEAAAETLFVRCKIPKEKIKVIYNGISSNQQKIIPLNKRPLEVLTVANINPRKGHAEYLKVIKIVLAKIPNVKFIFVGRDDMKNKIQEIAIKEKLSGAIKFEGFQKNVSKYFERARVFALPSLWGEGCPTSIIESYTWGVPVVAYKIDGISELIENEVDGFLVKLMDHENFAYNIISLLNDVNLSLDYGQKGKKKVKENFLLEKCSEEHVKCFQNLN